VQLTNLICSGNVFFCASKSDFCRRREENQLDATECFIAIIIGSTCFGHSYAHHQEFASILVLLPHMVCNALVAGRQLFGVEQQSMCSSSRTHSLLLYS